MASFHNIESGKFYCPKCSYDEIWEENKYFYITLVAMIENINIFFSGGFMISINYLGNPTQAGNLGKYLHFLLVKKLVI